MRSGEGIAKYCYEDIDVGEELRDQKGVFWEAGGGGLFVSGKVLVSDHFSSYYIKNG